VTGLAGWRTSWMISGLRGSGELVLTSISMFDVFNVQSLTRRRLLERTGIWEDILNTR